MSTTVETNWREYIPESLLPYFMLAAARPHDKPEHNLIQWLSEYIDSLIKEQEQNS